MRFASKGQPSASASRNSCALSPERRPRSTHTRRRGVASLDEPSVLPKLTAVFTYFPALFRHMLRTFLCQRTVRKSTIRDFEPRSNPSLKQRLAHIAGTLCFHGV